MPLHHVYAGCGGRNKGPDPLEVELQKVVGHLLWVLGIKPGSSERAARALNHSVVSPAFAFTVAVEPVLELAL